MAATIKNKNGHCIDCPPCIIKPLIAGRCQFHYWKYRESLSKQKPQHQKKRKEAQAVSLFFANQIKDIPKCCEECNKPFNFFASWTIKASIAHILPKRHFKSVATHPMNKVYLCLDCHTNFDNKGNEYAISMKLYPEMYRIVNEILLRVIPSNEMQHMPSYFL